MKIRPVTDDLLPKALALLGSSFPASTYEARLVAAMHENGRTLHEWVGIQANRVIAYIGFSNAYNGAEVCGLHLGPLVVKREFRQRGIGRELLQFALRQQVIKESTLYVLGAPAFFGKFGFRPCTAPVCPFNKSTARFMGIRNDAAGPFTVGYEPEFKTVK